MHRSFCMCLMICLPLAACSAQTSQPQPAARASAPAPAAPPAAPAFAPASPASDDACAQVLVVAWQGAERAPASITRDESAARARAESLRTRVESGEDLTALARTESDAPTSAARGGLLGTFARSEWPPLHDGLKAPVFALPVGGLGEIVRMPYGYVLARRCPVEKVHTRHILVRFAGAKNAGPEVRRTRDEAARRAAEIRNTLLDGADFAQVARTMSEDASAERGGDLGSVGRGRLAPEYERVAFSLSPGQPGPVVETEFGFHILERLP